jgi:hypothetical protein
LRSRYRAPRVAAMPKIGSALEPAAAVGVDRSVDVESGEGADSDADAAAAELLRRALADGRNC